ncbi:hypothetical protein [Nocardia sp. NPDC058114]|uniref:hypothetical protein n=1 Tax=Nocardia sp. NPDC058114 TaxID=3346346 RepID=UPI0036DA2330
MSFQVGDRVRVLGKATVTDLEVLEVDADGVPDRIRVKPVADVPGSITWVARAEWLVPAPTD